MPRPKDDSEKVFGKLTEYGYTKTVAQLIYYWYHHDQMKKEQIHQVIVHI
jgi:hypothetical protein